MQKQRREHQDGVIASSFVFCDGQCNNEKAMPSHPKICKLFGLQSLYSLHENLKGRVVSSIAPDCSEVISWIRKINLFCSNGEMS